MSVYVIETINFVRLDKKELTIDDKQNIKKIYDDILSSFEEAEQKQQEGLYDDIYYNKNDDSIQGTGNHFEFSQHQLVLFSKNIIPELIIIIKNNSEGQEETAYEYIHKGEIRHPSIESAYSFFQ